MKKAYFLSALTWCLLVFAACGEKEKSEEYYDIRVESQILEGAEENQLLLGRQYYQGETVRLIAEQVSAEDGTSVMDVYIQPAGKDRQLLMSGVSREYRSTQWYLDNKGNCFIPQTDGVIRLDGDGNMLYHSRTDGRVRDICGLEGGRLILLIEESGIYGLAELDPVTGVITKIDNVALGSGIQYIGASGDRLMLLDKDGFWHVDLKNGIKNSELPFDGTNYIFQSGAMVVDFWIDGNEAGIIWSSGIEEQLVKVDISEEREIIIVRGRNFDYVLRLKEQVQLFNQLNDTYYVVLEECGEETSFNDFRTETNLQLGSGKGADIIYGNALSDDMYSMITNGIFADLTPFMEASGMSEADYFPAAFDVWRHEGKIYGVNLLTNVRGYTMDRSLLGSGEDLTIETLLDIMLDKDEKRYFSSHWNERDILEYLLQGSENLWGMVDWEEGICDFSGEMFSRMLQAAKQCGYDERYDYPTLVDWRMLFGFYSYDTGGKMESKNLMMAGVLFDDGCHAAIEDYYTMGINARSKHIEGAWQLISFLLDEETQYALGYSKFPVNRNAFDRIAQEEIEAGAVEYHTTVIEGVTITRKGKIKGDEDLTQEAVDDMIRVLDDATPLPLRTQPLITIILEETADYFSGLKSKDEVIDVLQNRVQLYLDEHAKKK